MGQQTMKKHMEYKLFDSVDLIPNVLNGTEEIDMSVEIMGQKLNMPIYCSQPHYKD